jgi:hypothetical protein
MFIFMTAHAGLYTHSLSGASCSASALQRVLSAASARAQLSPAREDSFDAAEVCAAVRPSARAPALEADLPALRPELRPYQRRAAAWMVARERGELVRRPGSSKTPVLC